jgi:hypothetical protein
MRSDIPSFQEKIFHVVSAMHSPFAMGLVHIKISSFHRLSVQPNSTFELHCDCFIGMELSGTATTFPEAISGEAILI